MQETRYVHEECGGHDVGEEECDDSGEPRGGDFVLTALLEGVGVVDNAQRDEGAQRRDEALAQEHDDLNHHVHEADHSEVVHHDAQRVRGGGTEGPALDGGDKVRVASDDLRRGAGCGVCGGGATGHRIIVP